jgi:hypothetical protein
MRKMAEETRDVGAKTLQELDEQGGMATPHRNDRSPPVSVASPNLRIGVGRWPPAVAHISHTPSPYADKLRKTNQELNEIDNDLKAAEKTLTQMEKCCGCCSCPCYSSKNYERSNKDYKTVSYLRLIHPDQSAMHTRLPSHPAYTKLGLVQHVLPPL